MPALGQVILDLGLEPQPVHDLGWFKASRAQAAIGAEDGLRTGPFPSAADEQEALAARAGYASTHGFRAIGLIALFDQAAAVRLADELRTWLHGAGHLGWPLTTAVGSLPDRPGTASPAMATWYADAQTLAAEPASAARELARCLLPPDLQDAGAGIEWREDRAPAPWSRRALSIYGIDLELLRALVRGRVDVGGSLPVSEISMPAMVRTLFASIEAALREARDDAYHWQRGLTPIQPTDPEVLLTARACLRSPAAGPHVHELPGELPMSRAVVRLVETLEQGHR